MDKSVKSDILTSNFAYDASNNTITYPIKDDVDELKTSVSNLIDNESKLKSNVSKHTLEIHDLKVNIDRKYKELDSKIIDASIHLDKSIEENKNLTKLDIEMLTEKITDLEFKNNLLKQDYDKKINHIYKVIIAIIVLLIAVYTISVVSFNNQIKDMQNTIRSTNKVYSEYIDNNIEE